MNPNEDDNAVEFLIQSPIEKKFSVDLAKEVIQQILNDELKNKIFKEDEVEDVIKLLAMTLKNRFKTIVDSNYKLVIDVTLGEQRAADVRIITRQLWDVATDVVVTTSYENDSLFCVVIFCAVCCY